MGRRHKPMLPYGHFSYQERPKSTESLYGRVFEARDVVRFVNDDVRPWAEDLGRKKEYAALAAIFHVGKDDSVPFQLESRKGGRSVSLDLYIRRKSESNLDKNGEDEACYFIVLTAKILLGGEL